MEIEMEEGKPAEVNEEEDDLMKKRIFVGGLSEKVTEEDLRKTFSSLGTVQGVEFLRSNGRSFAYIDFQPSSSKSLSKLFSSYNGCVWKGGRLRLEKAKEHYMVRLRREWEEDADLAHKTNDQVVANEKNSPQKSKLLTLEKKQLQIFFPRLRKVKSVPYSGTGKHKYSFQRTEVPPLPIHFCDCEEHYMSSEIAKAKQVSDFEDKAGKVNEEELDMMRSVMNKIFKKEEYNSTDCSEVIVHMERGSSNHLIDDVPPNESDADQDNDDDDNLVINIVSDTKLGLMEKANQESTFGKRQRPTFGLTQNKIKAQMEKNNDPFNPSDTSSKKKQRLLPSDESVINEFASTMVQKKANQETYPKKSKDLPVVQPDQKGSKQQVPTGLLRRQKSSWRELVGETSNSSFSISHILPEARMKQNVSKSSGLDTASITNGKRKKPRKQDKSANSEFAEHAKDEIPEEKLSADGHSTDVQNSMKQVRCESTASEPVELTKEEILQDKVITDDPSLITQSGTTLKESESSGEVLPTDRKADNNQTVNGLDIASISSGKRKKKKPRKQERCKSPNSESAGHAEDEIPEDKVIVDGRSNDVQNSTKQGRCESAASEPLELTKEVQDKGSTEKSSIVAQSGIPLKESESPGEVQPTDQKADNNKTVAARSWIQKSSWTKLVGEIDNSSFSISNILPGVASKRQNLPNCTSTSTVNPFENKEQNLSKLFAGASIGNGSNGVGKGGILHEEITRIGSNMASSSKNQESLAGSEGLTEIMEKNSDNEKLNNTLGKKVSPLNHKSLVDTDFGEVCTFMRTKESEKEWMKTRAALSATLKKKSNEKSKEK